MMIEIKKASLEVFFQSFISVKNCVTTFYQVEAVYDSTFLGKDMLHNVVL